jgi:O-antigen/teichoic acid export membrane protein
VSSASNLGAAARRGVSWSVLAVAGSTVSGALQLGIAARFLAREDFGVMALIQVVLNLGQSLSDLGTANAVLYRQRAAASELVSLFWLNVAVGVGLFALTSASGELLAFLWEQPALALWLPLAAVVFLFVGAMQVPNALLQRELRFRALAVADIAAALASLAAVALFAMRGSGVASLVAGQIAGGAVRWLIATAACRTMFRPRFHFDVSEVRPFLDFGMYQLGERLVNFGWRNLDKLVIGTWIGVDALGAYTLAYQLMIRPVRFFAAASANVTRSVLARMQGDRDQLLSGYLTSVRVVALIAFPAYIGALATAEPLVRLVYGPGWDDVATLFTLLAPLGAFYAIGNPVGGLVVATGKARIAFLWNVFAAAVNLVAALIGARFGAHGVALGILVATAGVIFPAGFMMRWALVRLRPAPFLACLTRPMAYALIMGAAVHALETTLLAPLPALPKLLFAVGCGVAVYTALLWTRERALLFALGGLRA